MVRQWYASMARNRASSDERPLRRNARVGAQALAVDGGAFKRPRRAGLAGGGDTGASLWPCLELLSRAWLWQGRCAPGLLRARASSYVSLCVCVGVRGYVPVHVRTRASARVRVCRSMRAFRVIRLFGRLGSLRDIITALTAAIIPVIFARKLTGI